MIDDFKFTYQSTVQLSLLGSTLAPEFVTDGRWLILGGIYGTDAANMLFHVVNDRHRKKRATIFTTNKAVTAWDRVLHDEDLAHAIVDRILERGRMLSLDGPSLRTKHLGHDDPTSSEALHQPVRISGIEAGEFPEPTGCMLHPGWAEMQPRIGTRAPVQK